MLEWAAKNGKAVRQRTVRQETTKLKAGTLPLNIYATSAQPTEKITIEQVGAAGNTEEEHHEESCRTTYKVKNKNPSMAQSLKVNCRQL